MFASKHVHDFADVRLPVDLNETDAKEFLESCGEYVIGLWV